MSHSLPYVANCSIAWLPRQRRAARAGLAGGSRGGGEGSGGYAAQITPGGTRS